MRVFFYTLGFVLSATQVFAVREEVLFSCDGAKNKAGYTNVFTVKSTKSGKWETTFSLRSSSGYVKGDAEPQSLEITSFEPSETGCVIKVEQTAPEQDEDTKVPMKLVYEDKDLTLKGKKGSAFAKASCQIVSKNVRRQLNNCELKAKEEVSQGVLCRSEKVDKTENHIRIDINEDLTYAERSVYTVFKGEPEKLGTRAVDIRTTLSDGGKQCEVKITELHPTDKQKMTLVMKLNKPFGSEEVIQGRVEESKLIYKDEALTMPDHFKNMKCELSGDFYQKVKSCDIDMAAEGTADAAKRGYRVDPESAKENKTKQ